MADKDKHWHVDIGEGFRNNYTTRSMPFWNDYQFPLLTVTFENGHHISIYPGAEKVEISPCDNSECKVY